MDTSSVHIGAGTRDIKDKKDSMDVRVPFFGKRPITKFKRKWAPLLFSTVIILLISVLSSRIGNQLNYIIDIIRESRAISNTNTNVIANIDSINNNGGTESKLLLEGSARWDFTSKESVNAMLNIASQYPLTLSIPDTLRTYYNHSHPFLNVAILTHPRKNSIHLLHTVDSFFIGFMAWANDNHFEEEYPKNWMPFAISMLERDKWRGKHKSMEAIKQIYQEYIEDGYISILKQKKLDYKYHQYWDDIEDLDTKESHARRFSHALDFLMTINDLSSQAGKYILFIEDDFPLCPDGMHKILERISEAEKLEHLKGSTPCGLFIGTGGSGFILRRDTGLKELIHYMTNLDEESILESPHDVTIQNFMLHSNNICKNRWYIVDSLYIYHTGWLHSTRGVLYDRTQWQCRWMNPLLPNVPSSNILLTNRPWKEYFNM